MIVGIFPLLTLILFLDPDFAKHRIAVAYAYTESVPWHESQAPAYQCWIGRAAGQGRFRP